MAVEHDEDGLPSSWCLQIVVPTHLAITKEHEKKLSECEKEIQELKEKNQKLKDELQAIKDILSKNNIA